MKITASFNRQFEWETLQSEKLRAAILAGYSLFTCSYILGVSFLVHYNAVPHPTQFKLPLTLLIFLGALFFYELTANRILNYRLKSFDQPVHSLFKYLNALIELSTITIMLYFYTIYFNHLSLLSDVVLISLYYLIVFLSAFYLDRNLCIITGVLACIGYTFLHILQPSEKINTTLVEDFLYNRYFIYATGILLMLCGIAAAFMANQLKNGIKRSVDLVEDENKLFTLFSRQISREVATALLDKDGKIPSELKFVSVMFIDIRNFTVYAEAEEPEKIVKFQNSYFGIITEVVNNYQGIVNQFLGDGCMITFGAPVAVDNAPQHAIKAALEIKDALEKAIANNEMHSFRIGIGIHCGFAVTGNIGTPLKSEYSISGNVVILAARIEQLNKLLNSTILMSKEAYDHAKLPEVIGENMGASIVKGWSHPVEIVKLA